jgi:hypothetical protein
LRKSSRHRAIAHLAWVQLPVGSLQMHPDRVVNATDTHDHPFDFSEFRDRDGCAGGIFAPGKAMISPLDFRRISAVACFSRSIASIRR